MFENVAFVWGESMSEGPLPKQPGVGVPMWPEVLGCDTLRWQVGEMPDISAYDLFLVNLFHTADSTHIAQIRAAKPDAVIVAMPDPPIDQVVNTPEWLEMFRQMALADWIGGRTEYDCQVYGLLLNKPSIHLPSPIGPTEWFQVFRDVPKEDVIVTQDHGFSSPASAQNVAALAALQRETGFEVLYARPFDHTKEYARLAGLRVQWEDNIPFAEFVEATARATLCVDLYARHSYHRHAVVCAMVGTPCITGDRLSHLGQLHTDPFRPDNAVHCAKRLLYDKGQYDAIRDRGFLLVEVVYGFEASCERMQKFVDQVL